MCTDCFFLLWDRRVPGKVIAVFADHGIQTLPLDAQIASQIGLFITAQCVKQYLTSLCIYLFLYLSYHLIRLTALAKTCP